MGGERPFLILPLGTENYLISSAVSISSCRVSDGDRNLGPFENDFERTFSEALTLETYLVFN